MPSNFAAEWAAAEPDMDAELGESFLYQPYAPPSASGAPDVNARPLADPDRMAAAFVGRFFERPHQTPPMGRNKPASSAHRLSGGAPVLNLSGVAARALQAALAGGFRVNDQVIRLSDEQVFRIEDIQPCDLDMVEFVLTRVGCPTS